MKKNIEVLLVDGDIMTRRRLRNTLEAEEGLKVRADCGSAEEAFEQMRTLSPDVILMSMRLPGVDGLEATRRLKGKGSSRSISVVILAECGDYLIEAMEAGAAAYLPREMSSRITSSGFFDLAECAAPVLRKHPVQFVPFADVLKNRRLVNKAGFEPYASTIHTLIGEANVKAGRLLAGVTMSKEGNWTSWPPHDHSTAKEEIYLYVDMPAPNFAVHLNYWDFRDPEVVTIVREGDAVAIQKGYHYNVAAPGTVTTFLWMMAAIREEEDRVFTQVTVQPEFDGRFKLF